MRRRWLRFLDGVGFLDAMLTSFLVFSVVLCAITIIYTMFRGRM